VESRRRWQGWALVFAELTESIEGTNDPDLLRQWLLSVLQCDTWEELSRILQAAAADTPHDLTCPGEVPNRP
jgi:hypothetical protein